MKLRLRSSKTKETLKLEVPNPCTLQHLKQLISEKLPSSSSSSSTSSNSSHSPTIYLSLNQKDELTTSSPEQSIQSTGITSGDLIYFTTNPTPSPQFIPPSSSPPPENPQTTLTPNPEEETEPMEIDLDLNSTKSFSVPGFLRKVFTQELGNENSPNHKLLAIAVRAVLLESGFLEIDPVSFTIQNSNNFHIQQNWHLTTFHFTLPGLITSNNPETIKIKFQSLGKFCYIYGCLTNGIVHSVVLNEEKLVPFLNVVWANCGETIVDNNNGVVLSIEPEKEVFEFWRKTKDGVALPCLIDLCEKTGLVLPPCFMRLPSEIKLKILELVSGVDVANVSCVCSELRYLGASDDLWKEKYVKEFGSGSGGGGFKERFGKAWEGRKRRRAVGVGNGGRLGMRYRNPFGSYIIGGNYDIYPGLGGGPRLRTTRLLPDCNLNF